MAHSVCILDTSVVCEILSVPGKSGSLLDAAGAFEAKLGGETLRQCQLHPARRVYVWSLDEHLVACDRAPHHPSRRRR